MFPVPDSKSDFQTLAASWDSAAGLKPWSDPGEVSSVMPWSIIYKKLTNH